MTDQASKPEQHAAPPESAAAPLHSQTFSAHDSALSLNTDDDDPSPDDGDFADVEQQREFDDNDSAFGGSLIGCDTDTLASFITDYRYENGRRYHAYRDGEYWVCFLPWEVYHTD